MLIEGKITLILWRKTFQFTELNAFAASSRRTASECSLYISYIASMAASHPGSCPAHTCNGPIDEMMSSRRIDTITFPTILLSTTSKSDNQNPGFLSNGIH